MRLGIPVVSYVQKVIEIKEGQHNSRASVEDGHEIVEVKRPCGTTCVKRA
jgi:electron transfer flavoprotein beta subunit